MTTEKKKPGFRKDRSKNVRSEDFIAFWISFGPEVYDDHQKLIAAFQKAFPQLAESTIQAKMKDAHKKWKGLPPVPRKGGGVSRNELEVKYGLVRIDDKE